VKSYRSPRAVVADVSSLVARNRPSTNSPSLLVHVAKLLHDARHYYRVGIYLVVNNRVVHQAVCGPELPQSGGSGRSEIAAPIKLGTETLGFLRAEGEHTGGAGLSPEDRVLLKEVASILARYLRGKGRFLMRNAREAVRQAAAAVVEDRTRASASPVKPEVPRRERLRAAAGEKVSA
jgi:hypothetical protein